MNWKSSFDATGEAIAMRYEGDRAVAEAIARFVVRMIAKISSLKKRHPAAAE
jgi:hypothetical protein